MTNRYMKKFSIPLINGKMQIKGTMWYCLIPVRMPIIRKAKDNYCWRCKEIGTTIVGMYNDEVIIYNTAGPPKNSKVVY
jgi:hypothetical protein